MKATIISVVALACTSHALPVSSTITSQVQKLERTISDVVRDLNQGDASLQKDYTAGMDQYALLISESPLAESCSPIISFPPKSEEGAIAALMESRELLLRLEPTPHTDLRRDLNDFQESTFDPAQTTADSSQPDICTAYARYYAVMPFLKEL